MSKSAIENRKLEHIEIAASGNADFRNRSTLLESVHLTHQSLPEIGMDDIDLRTEFLGKTLAAPILITGMTGGTGDAASINRDLAVAAEQVGVAFGLGSQRAMVEQPELATTYKVRDLAPNALIIGNIGVMQAAEYGTAKIQELVRASGVDAMAVHLNPAQEMIQSHGDRNFVGALACIERLCHELSVPVIVKETGCGISFQAAQALRKAGVTHVDVSGAGGTSWVAVEQQRATTKVHRSLGEEYWDWGVPTAVAVHACVRAGLSPVASGGVRSGMDIARAMGLGACMGGMAAPFLRAQQSSGVEGVVQALGLLCDSLKIALLLTGCTSPAALANAPKHIAQPLRSWLDDIA